MNPKLKEKILESLSAVLPITGIVLLLSIFLVPLETGAIVMFFVGALLLIIGMGMFQLGAEMAMSPLGEGIGVQISKLKHLFFIALISLLMGVLITMAERGIVFSSRRAAHPFKNQSGIPFDGTVPDFDPPLVFCAERFPRRCV